MMINIRALVLGFPRPVKRGIVVLVDVVLMAVAVWLAFYLRIGVFVPFWATLSGISLLNRNPPENLLPKGDFISRCMNVALLLLQHHFNHTT